MASSRRSCARRASLRTNEHRQRSLGRPPRTSRRWSATTLRSTASSPSWPACFTMSESPELSSRFPKERASAELLPNSSRFGLPSTGFTEEPATSWRSTGSFQAICGWPVVGNVADQIGDKYSSRASVWRGNWNLSLASTCGDATDEPLLPADPPTIDQGAYGFCAWLAKDIRAASQARRPSMYSVLRGCPEGWTTSCASPCACRRPRGRAPRRRLRSAAGLESRSLRKNR